MTDAAVKRLVNESTTVRVSPGYEGANIGTIIGFKHVNYLIEKAVIEHFRVCGLPVGALYEDSAAGFDIVVIDTRLTTALIVDDEVTIEVVPKTKDEDTELAFKVSMTVTRDGEAKRAVTSKVRAVLRRDDNDMRVLRTVPVPDGLERFVTERIGTEPVTVDGIDSGAQAAALTSGGSTEDDPILEQLTADANAYAWKFRIPYPFVHFFDRMPVSGYLRLMEEAKHRFVDARGISIRKLLAEQNWIPAVTQSSVQILDEALLEEDLYVVYTVDSIFKNLLYTSRLDYYVVRDGRLVRTAQGSITHGYGIVENGKEGKLVEWDDRVATALSGGRAS